MVVRDAEAIAQQRRLARVERRREESEERNGYNSSERHLVSHRDTAAKTSSTAAATPQDSLSRVTGHPFRFRS